MMKAEKTGRNKIKISFD